MNTKKESSGFSGFLDSYKAGNISAAKSSIEFHYEAIKESLQNLIAKLEQEGRDEVVRALRKSNNILEKNQGILDKMLSFGESFKSNVDIDLQNIDVGNKDIIKIIYHYGKIARISEDTTLIKNASYLGELVERE